MQRENIPPSLSVCIQVPGWSLVAAAMSGDLSLVDDSLPASVAVVANRVTDLTADARAAGITIGMRRREVQARLPTVQIVKPDDDREQRMFASVVSSLQDISPWIEVTKPGQLFFAARGPARRMGGLDAVIAHARARVDAICSRAAAHCKVGVADGTFAASHAARLEVVAMPDETADFLASLSTHAIEDPDFVTVLQQLGIMTFAQFGQLTGPDVLARFGDAAAHLHRLVKGIDRPTVRNQPIPPNTRSVLISKNQ